MVKIIFLCIFLMGCGEEFALVEVSTTGDNSGNETDTNTDTQTETITNEKSAVGCWDEIRGALLTEEC